MGTGRSVPVFLAAFRRPQAGDTCSLAPKLLVTDRPSFGTYHGTDPTSIIPNVYAVWYGCTDPGG
jgi:hypothetical protein